MKVRINKNEINIDFITVNDGLNYGRFFNKNTKDYEIQLSIKNFIELIEKEYIEIRDEIRIDDETHKIHSDFTNTKYCPLQELLKQPKDLEEIVKTYLDITLFTKIFNASSQNKYVINSTDSIQVTDKDVVIKGRVFEIT